MKVGFIGLGQMGKPMAMNLVADTSLVVFDQDRENSAPLVQRGASCAYGLGDFAQVDIIFLSLPNSKVVETVVCGEGGLVEMMRPGMIVVDTSTIEYGATLAISEQLCRKGIEFIDAPVSGMQSRAEEGNTDYDVWW